jgi:transposase
MKAYSLDFRQKIMDVYHNEPLSQKAIANRFCVTRSLRPKIAETVS